MKPEKLKLWTPVLLIWILVDVLLTGIGVLPVWIGWLGYAAFAVAAIVLAVLGGEAKQSRAMSWALVGAMAVFGAILLLLTFFTDIEPAVFQ